MNQEEEKQNDVHYTFDFLNNEMKMKVLFEGQQRQEKLLKEQNQKLEEIRKSTRMTQFNTMCAIVFGFIGMAAAITTCNRLNQSESSNTYDPSFHTRPAKMPNACDSTHASSTHVLTL